MAISAQAYKSVIAYANYATGLHTGQLVKNVDRFVPILICGQRASLV
jgi:hypothetical protein